MADDVQGIVSEVRMVHTSQNYKFFYHLFNLQNQLVSDLVSVAGSKASARSQSPSGSTAMLSDRVSLASGSLHVGVIPEQLLSPQQYGVMGNLN